MDYQATVASKEILSLRLVEAEENCASIFPHTGPSAARERVASTAVKAASFSRPNEHEGLRFAWHGIARKTSWREDGYGGSEGALEKRAR